MRLKYFFPIFTWSVLIIFLLYQAIIPSSTAFAKSDADVNRIGGIEINSTKKNEIKSLLSTEVTKWRQEDIILRGATAKIVVPHDYINFDLNKTVENYITETSSPWYKFWSGRNKVNTPIVVMLDEEIYRLFDAAPLFYVDESIEALKDHASYLKDGDVPAKEVELTKDLLERTSFEVQDILVDGTGMDFIVEELNDMTLLNNEEFSFLSLLEEVGSYYSAETADFVASSLYSTVLQSELNIQERHSQNVKPKYLEPGIEVKVNENRRQDFSFSNQTNGPVILSASITDDQLLIELYTVKSDYEITYEVRNKEIVEPRTINRLTFDLPVGTEKVEVDGKDGLRVQVYKVISEVNGSYMDEVLISRDFYPPENEVLLVSANEPVEVIVDEDYDSGDSSSDNDYDSSDSSGSSNSDDSSDSSGSSSANGSSGSSDSDNTGSTTGKPGKGDAGTVGSQGNGQDKDDPESDGSYYDKGGNLITPDTK